MGILPMNRCGEAKVQQFITHTMIGLVLCTCAASTSAQQPQKIDPILRMEEGVKLKEAGNFKDALDAYLWCFDHGLEHSMAFVGVRLSYLIGEFQELAKVYPPTKDALSSRAGEREFVIALMWNSRETIWDYVALCEAMDDLPRAVRTYDRLAIHGPRAQEIRQEMAEELIEQFVKMRRYRDAVNAIPSLTRRLVSSTEVSQMVRESIQKELRTAKLEDRQILLREVEEIVLHSELIVLYEAYLGAGQSGSALLCAMTATSIQPNRVTFMALAEAARRTGNEPVATQWETTARALPATQPARGN